jgi:hypothetical protein
MNVSKGTSEVSATTEPKQVTITKIINLDELGRNMANCLRILLEDSKKKNAKTTEIDGFHGALFTITTTEALPNTFYWLDNLTFETYESYKPMSIICIKKACDDNGLLAFSTCSVLTLGDIVMCLIGLPAGIGLQILHLAAGESGLISQLPKEKY